jgi:hypothetical protein
MVVQEQFPGERKYEHQLLFQPVTLNKDKTSGRLKMSSINACNLLNLNQIKTLFVWSFSWNKKSISRFYRVLMMVYNTQNYWGFGLYPSSGF